MEIPIRLQMGNVVVGPTIYTQHQYSMYMRWNENSSQVDIVILVCYTGFNNLNRFDYLPYGELSSGLQKNIYINTIIFIMVSKNAYYYLPTTYPLDHDHVMI